MEGNSVVKLEKSKQKSLQTISKVVYVLAKIGKIFSIIGAVFAAIGIMIGIVFLNNIDIRVKDSNNIQIAVKDFIIDYKDENNKVSLKVQDEEVELDDEESVQAARLMATMSSKISKTQIITYLAVTLIFTVVGLILTVIILNYVENLFKNIAKQDTPFTVENVDIIKKIGWYMVASTVVSAVGNGISSTITDSSFSMEYGFNLIMILIVFAASYIFEYGCNMQLDSNAKIYGTEEE